MENVKKNPIGKIGKVALCGAIALGSVASMVGYNFIKDSKNVSAMYVSGVYSDGAKNVNLSGFHYMDDDSSYSHVKVADNYSRDSYYDEMYEDYVYTYSSSINSGNRLLTFDIDLASSNNTNIYVTATLVYNANNYEYGSGGKKVTLYHSLAVDGKSVVIPFATPSDMDNSKISYIDVYASRTGDYSTSDMYFDCFVNNLLLSDGDTMAPALETQVFLTDVDSPFSLEYILSKVKFVDEIDGDIEEVVVSDNYSPNKNKVGKWTIEVKATDKAGNTGTGVIEVWVQDRTSPIINGKTTYTSNMSSPLTREYIESQLSVNDNVDENVELILVTDNFTGNENIVGQKTIIYRATDSAGNTSGNYTITINCVDDIKPTITGENNYTTSYKVAIDVNTIKSVLTLKDNISNDLELELVSDNYTGNQSIPGTYYLKYRTIDPAGNISDVFTITIVVNDKIPPVFYTSGLFIGVSKAETLSHQEIVNILLAMNGLENSNMGVALLSLDGYEVDSINQPMAYSIRYQLVNEDGTNYGEELTATINVLGEEEVKENDTEVQVEQRVNKVKEFFEEVWNGIKNIGEFFVKLFKTITFGWLWDKDGKFDPKWTEWH